MGGMIACSSVYALDEQFNDALRAANASNTALLDQYQFEMQNDALGYYPEYWKLNTNLGFQPASSIISFAQRYPVLLFLQHNRQRVFLPLLIVGSVVQN